MDQDRPKETGYQPAARVHSGESLGMDIACVVDVISLAKPATGNMPYLEATLVGHLKAMPQPYASGRRRPGLLGLQDIRLSTVA
jgi:hypothetical protein